MKIQSLILSVFLIVNGQALYAASALAKTKEEPKKNTAVVDYFRKITPELLYGYTGFHFNSTQGDNYNRYQGHSNLYSTGVDHISLGSSLMAGVYYLGVDTKVNSQFLFNPGSVTRSQQTIHNNTIFAHLLKIFTPQIYADLSGGYGYNKLTTLTQIASSPTELVAQASNNTNNWFLSFNTIYRKPLKRFLLRANLGVLYSEIDSGSYNYIFPASGTAQKVDPLTNRATLLLENAELGYVLNPKLMPFVNAGLIQVAQFSNSRPLISSSTIINGSLPQLNMNKSGFRLGAGLAYNYKNLSLRVEEKYYKAGRTFESYQTIAAFEYQFN